MLDETAPRQLVLRPQHHRLCVVCVGDVLVELREGRKESPFLVALLSHPDIVPGNERWSRVLLAVRNPGRGRLLGMSKTWFEFETQGTDCTMLLMGYWQTVQTGTLPDGAPVTEDVFSQVEGTLVYDDRWVDLPERVAVQLVGHLRRDIVESILDATLPAD